MQIDSVSSSNTLSISAMEILTLFIVLFTAITAYIQLKSRKALKPIITRIVCSSNGSRVSITVTNNNIHNIIVNDNDVFIAKYYFRYLISKKHKVEIHKHNDRQIVISTDPNVRDNIEIMPPKSFWFIKYKITVKTSGGKCSIIYNPPTMKDLSKSLLTEYRLSLNWLQRKIYL